MDTKLSEEDLSYEGGETISESSEELVTVHKKVATACEKNPCAKLSMKAKEFHCQKQKLLFTYASHIDKKKLYRFFEKVSNITPKFIRAAHESGTDSVPYLHTHVVVDWGKAFSWRDVRKFDWIHKDEGEWKDKDPSLPYKKGGRCMHPNLRFIANKKGDWERTLNYIAKDDISNSDLKMKPNLVKGIQSCKTVTDALTNYCKRPGDANTICTIYNHKVDEVIYESFYPQDWQFELLIILNNVVIKKPEVVNPHTGYIPGRYVNGEWVMGTNCSDQSKRRDDDRHIHVMYDPLGGSGKTVLAKALVRTDPVKYLLLNGCGVSRNMATVMAKSLRAGWSGHTVFIDLIRTKADHSIYESIEQIRDGGMTIQKYQGRPLSWDSVCVVILTNWMPNLKMMTLDRWVIFEIEHGDDMGLGSLMPMGLKEALKVYKSELASRSREGVEGNSEKSHKRMQYD